MSDRQWRDVVGLVTAHLHTPALDDLEEIAAQLGLTDLLTRAVSDAGQHR